MSFVVLLIRKHLQKITISFVVLIILCSALAFSFSSKKVRFLLLQSQDFTFSVDKSLYQIGEAVTFTVTGAAPNTAVYWGHARNDVWEQQGVFVGDYTDASGNFTHIVGPYSSGLVGSWEYSVSIGTVTKAVRFTVGSKTFLTTEKKQYALGEIRTYIITGAAPNSPIYWRNCHNKVCPETDQFYGEYTDANGNFSVAGPLPAGYEGHWEIRAKISGAWIGPYEFTVDVPFIKAGSLREKVQEWKTPGNNDLMKGMVYFTVNSLNDEYTDISFCEAMQKYSLIHANARQRVQVVKEDRIETWIRLTIIETFRDRPFLNAGQLGYGASPPPEMVANLGPNDIMVFYIGGTASIDGMSVYLTQQSTPFHNFIDEFGDLAEEAIGCPMDPNLCNTSETLMFVEWDKQNKIGYLSLHDKSVFRIGKGNAQNPSTVSQKCRPPDDPSMPNTDYPGCLIKSALGYIPNPNTFYKWDAELRQWIYNHPDC